jgi:hypothetical protein
MNANFKEGEKRLDEPTGVCLPRVIILVAECFCTLTTDSTDNTDELHPSVLSVKSVVNNFWAAGEKKYRSKGRLV